MAARMGDEVVVQTRAPHGLGWLSAINATLFSRNNCLRYCCWPNVCMWHLHSHIYNSHESEITQIITRTEEWWWVVAECFCLSVCHELEIARNVRICCMNKIYIHMWLWHCIYFVCTYNEWLLCLFAFLLSAWARPLCKCSSMCWPGAFEVEWDGAGGWTDKSQRCWYAYRSGIVQIMMRFADIVKHVLHNRHWMHSIHTRMNCVFGEVVLHWAYITSRRSYSDAKDMVIVDNWLREDR